MLYFSEEAFLNSLNGLARKSLLISAVMACFLVLASNAQADSAKVQAYAQNSTTPPPMENISLRIINQGSDSIALASWRVRYWFNDSEALSNIKSNDWWYSLGSTSAINQRFGGDSAQRYVDITFLSGVLAPGAYAEVQFGLNNSDWKVLNNSLAYSSSSTSGFADNGNVALYHGDTLIWGKPYSDTSSSGSSTDTSSSSSGGSSSGTGGSGSSGNNGSNNVLLNPISNELENAQYYAVWGVQSVRLSDRTRVMGKVGAGHSIDIGANAIVMGDAASADSLSVRSYGKVTGVVRAPTVPQLQEGASIQGGSILQTFPALTFEDDSVTAASTGTSDFWVDPRTSATLNPGNYSSITIGAGAIVTVNPGAIHASSVYVNPDAVLIFSTGALPTSVVSSGSITIGDRVTMMFNAEANPVALSFLAAQDVTLGNDDELYGRYLAYGGALTCYSRTMVRGSLQGNTVDVEPDTRVALPPTLETFTHSLYTYGPAFRPWKSSYVATVPDTASVMQIWAKALDSTAQVMIDSEASGISVSLSGEDTIVFNVTDTTMDTFISGAGTAEYRLVVDRSSNYAIRLDQKSSCVQCDGTDWATAFNTWPAAIKAARAQGKQLWIDSGTFVSGGKDSNFVLEPGLAIYGGFKGISGESEGNRKGNFQKVIFSGDNSNDDGGVWNTSFANKSDNSRHVLKVLHGGGLPHGDLLNGAVIFGGYDSSAGSFGGGIEAVSASLELDYVALQGNLSHSGGAVYLWKSDSTHITNTYFIGNHAINGSALGEYGTHAYLANCVVQGNVSDSGLFAVSGGIQRVVFVSMGGNNLGSGVIARSDSGQLVIDRSVFWSNTYQQNLGYLGNSIAWSNSDVQGGITGSSWNRSMGTDSGGNLTTDPSWNSASRADDGNGNLLSEHDGLDLSSGSNLSSSVPNLSSDPFDKDIFQFVRLIKTAPGSYEAVNTDSNTSSLGYYNSKTGMWTPATRINVLNPNRRRVGSTMATAADYYIRILLPANKYADEYVGSSFYADVCLKDENDQAVTSSIRMMFYQCGTVDGKRAYYNILNDGSGAYQKGKMLLLVNDKSYENNVYDHVQALYVPTIASSRCGLFVSVPHHQFTD